VRNAYRHFRHQQHDLRLNASRRARVERHGERARIEAVSALWRAVFDS
ncbi:MAG TPA: hypothetical protein PLF25_02835, partial [Accumulibacter sp.]|nr:hypothetical protein [Accumulibacter sp.]